MQVFSPELISPVVSFLGFFIYIRNTYFQEHLQVFVIHVFYSNVSSDNLISFFLCFFKKSDALYLFPTNRLLSIIIDKFTIIEFAILIRNVPFLAPPSTLGEQITEFLWFSEKVYFRSPLAVCLIYYRCDPLCRLDEFAFLEFLLSFIFVNVISLLQLIFQKTYSYSKYDGIIYLTI